MDLIDPWGNPKHRPHPAKFSDSIVPVLRDILPDHLSYVVDPMAGVGKIVEAGFPCPIICNEIEPEWSSQIKQTDQVEVLTGDCRDIDLPIDRDNGPLAVVTSPPYGNRMADFFVSKRPESMKHRYAGDLGRKLSKGSVASVAFGDTFKTEMLSCYQPIWRQMQKGDLFVLNVSNFIRSYEEQNVESFFIKIFLESGEMVLDELRPVGTPRNRGVGANYNLRVNREVVMLFRKLTGSVYGEQYI